MFNFFRKQISSLPLGDSFSKCAWWEGCGHSLLVWMYIVLNIHTYEWHKCTALVYSLLLFSSAENSPLLCWEVCFLFLLCFPLIHISRLVLDSATILYTLNFYMFQISNPLWNLFHYTNSYKFISFNFLKLYFID